jgi:hypothetical protein
MAGTEQLNEVLVLRVTAEFQGFVRDMLDLATIKIVRGSGCGLHYQPPGYGDSSPPCWPKNKTVRGLLAVMDQGLRRATFRVLF